MHDTQTATILGTFDRRSNRAGQEHTTAESNSFGDGEGIRINAGFRVGGSTALANRGDAVTLDADHAHIKDLISIFGAKSRVDGTSAEARQAYANCIQALDAVFAKWGAPCK